MYKCYNAFEFVCCFQSSMLNSRSNDIGYHPEEPTPRFPDQHLGPRTDILRRLEEFENHLGPVSGPENPRRVIDRNYTNRLSDRVDVTHGLVTRLYCRVVVENQHLSLESADRFRRWVLLGEYHHTLSQLRSSDLLQGEAAFQHVRRSSSAGVVCPGRSRTTHETLWPASAVSTSTRFF